MRRVKKGYLVAMPFAHHLEREPARQALVDELRDDVTCDALTRDFVMFQRRRGHRHSTDDLLTAWYAVKHLPPAPSASPLRLLDLGSGVGSIGLAVLWAARAAGHAEARLTAIEAQDVSYRLLRANVTANLLQDTVELVHGDLREDALLPQVDHELITGSPPYFDVRAGVVSADSQRAHARFELRGDVSDYARAAARRLGARGRFVLCFPTVQRKRAEAACAAAGLRLVHACDVVPKAGLPPLFTVFAYGSASYEGPASEDPPFVVRTASGDHTPALREVQACFGLPGRGR